jgi:hypothetical protein
MVTKTIRASRVEKWIRAIKLQFLDAASIKCVGLDYEFTNPREGRENQCAAILQLWVASEVLVFKILRIIPKPTNNPIPSLYDLSNATIGPNLEKKKRKKKDKKKDDEEEEEDDLIFGWGNVPLSFELVMYAALDARLGLEIARC